MELTTTIIEAIQDLKGKKIVNIDLSKIETAICSNFIICEGGSNTQVSAIADSVVKYTKANAKVSPNARDGENLAQWIAIDYGHIMVHIFQRETREHYNLEGLWADGEINEIADLD